MALLSDQVATFSRFQENYTSCQHRPMMLKDFLRDDVPHSCTSSSSSSSSSNNGGFSMSPCKSTSIVLLRSWSRKAAATKISAIHKVIKLLQFASSKSPSVLPRSISRKLKKSNKGKNDIFGDVSEVKLVKVKDILRWRSFRDVVEDYSTPLDFPSSPNRSINTATTTTTTSSCSKRSSWCESDFTAEELPLWGGENEEFWGKKCFLDGTDGGTLRNSKRDWLFEESEQKSPVSVLHSPFREGEEFISPFHHPTLANVQRAKCNLTRRIQEHSFEQETSVFEGVNAVEEKAKKLLSHVKEDGENDQVILGFFLHELSTNGKLHDDEFDSKILRIAKSWINGEFDESYEWEVEDKRESYVKDMEKGVGWNKFEEEQEGMSKELEVMVLNELLDDLLVDLLAQ